MQTNHDIKKSIYTIEQLCQDISRQLQKEVETSKASMRDAENKLKVIFYIISMAQKVDNNKDYDQENVINSELNNDNSLFAYTFYVASHSQFDYSWNYLRKQWTEFETRLNGACAFVLDMIEKANKLLVHLTELSVDSFVFADIFVLNIDKETNCPYMEIQWEALNNIFQLSKGYYLSVKQGNGIVMTHFLAKNKKDEIDSFIKQLTDRKD